LGVKNNEISIEFHRNGTYNDKISQMYRADGTQT
jgi:hypothetical protein